MNDDYYHETARWQSASEAADAWGFTSAEALRAYVNPCSPHRVGKADIYDIEATYQALCASSHPIADAAKIATSLTPRGKLILGRYLRDAIRNRSVNGIPEVVDQDGIVPSDARKFRHRAARARRIVELVTAYLTPAPANASDVHYCLRMVHPNTPLDDYRVVAHVAANIRSAMA